MREKIHLIHAPHTFRHIHGKGGAIRQKYGNADGSIVGASGVAPFLSELVFFEIHAGG